MNTSAAPARAKPEAQRPAAPVVARAPAAALSPAEDETAGTEGEGDGEGMTLDLNQKNFLEELGRQDHDAVLARLGARRRATPTTRPIRERKER